LNFNSYSYHSPTLSLSVSLSLSLSLPNSTTNHVKAIGVLAGDNSLHNRSLDLIYIDNIQDGNECTHHLLEIILTHLQRIKAPRITTNDWQPWRFKADTKPLSLFSGSDIWSSVVESLTVLQRKVREHVKEFESDREDGVKGAELRSAMLGLATFAETNAAVEHLCKLGLLYTVSTDVYRSCARSTF